MFCKKSQKILKNYREEPVLESFHCKVLAWNSSQKSQSKGYFNKKEYTEVLTQVLSCKLKKNYEHNFEHLCETASEIMSKKEFVI